MDGRLQSKLQAPFFLYTKQYPFQYQQLAKQES